MNHAYSNRMIFHSNKTSIGRFWGDRIRCHEHLEQSGTDKAILLRNVSDKTYKLGTYRSQPGSYLVRSPTTPLHPLLNPSPSTPQHPGFVRLMLTPLLKGVYSILTSLEKTLKIIIYGHQAH